MTFEEWPDCPVPGCQFKICLALDSDKCFHHTPGNRHVKRWKIAALGPADAPFAGPADLRPGALNRGALDSRGRVKSSFVRALELAGASQMTIPAIPIGSTVVAIDPERDPEHTLVAFVDPSGTRHVIVASDGWHVLPQQIIGADRVPDAAERERFR